MKIGLVLSQTPGYSETFFISKIKGLQRNGVRVTLFVQRKNPNFNLCPVCVAPKVYKRNVLLQGINSLTVLLKLMAYPKRWRTFLKLEKAAHRTTKQILKNVYNNAHILMADLDWLHFGFATMALQSEHVAKAIGAKMAVSFRGYDVEVYPLKHPKCYEHLWKQVDQVHSISQYLLNKAYTLGLSKTTPFHIITPAIEIGNFKRGKVKSGSTLQLLTIGRLEWIKGLIYSLEAMALLKQRGIEFQYNIIGDGSLKEELLFAIHQLGLSDCVNLLYQIPHESIPNHFNVNDIYIQYSISEGFSNAVLEAQGMGLLCVVSNGGALPENVLHEQTGWVVKKRNPLALAETLLKVINLPEEIKMDVQSNAQNRVKKSFNLKKQQKDFIKFYY